VKLLALLLPIMLMLAAIAVASKRRQTRAGSADGPWPYDARQVISRPELILHRHLVAALPGHIVLAQVQVSRVLGVRKGFDFHAWNNRINRLSYDFVVCTPDGNVLAAIELDDKSHEAPDRIEADQRKDRATASAGIPLIRWHVKAIPEPAKIQAQFAGLRPRRAGHNS
jgi:hypothetical protein